ncbi:cyclase family protein [Streptomyces sp. AC495_CC817]|uniref:cyclase family protein n=1 Tax=Streptomyces sp. AC495_CC817 TaxID=2823900 RepID=UPI001C251F74|nr:cyclase family protein [Streptomyces sp. AC495_CC817]
MTLSWDLTHVLRDGMPVYPGDPEVTFATTAEIDTDGVAVTALHLSTHTGTHLDAPSHSIRGGRTAAEIDLDEVRGPALVLHLEPLAPFAEITVEVLERAYGRELPPTLPPIIVLDAGWAQHYGSARAFEHPALTPAAGEMLVARGMHVLGVDSLSPDPTSPDGTSFPVHDLILGADGIIVENLCNLDALPALVDIEIVPLPIDADGATVRVTARDGGAQHPRGA